MHITCDALGNPTAFHLTECQVYDRQGTDVLLPELAEKIGSLFADKAYDVSTKVLDVLKTNGVRLLFP